MLAGGSGRFLMAMSKTRELIITQIVSQVCRGQPPASRLQRKSDSHPTTVENPDDIHGPGLVYEAQHWNFTRLRT
jgi:hypothetical protein